MKIFTLTICLLMITINTNAQNLVLQIAPDLKLPKDSLESKRLLYSLDEFLSSAQNDASLNPWVYKSQLLQTQFLLDEIEGVQLKKGENEARFYKPTLLDVSPLELDQFSIQIAYIGVSNNIPETKAILRLIAHKTKNGYLFSSPISRNTIHWKTLTYENYTFYYQNEIDFKKSKEYVDRCKYYDQYLNDKPLEMTMYLIEDGFRTQDFFGLIYKTDYNGRTTNMSWRVFTDDRGAYIYNQSDFYDFDPHDLWHAQYSLVGSRKDVNKSVDEGIAVLHGGTWGYSWPELLVFLQEEIHFNKNTNWLKLREEKTVFNTGDRKSNTDFIVNALFVKKIENELGFDSVLELLKAKEEKAYFEILEKLTGVNKVNYNQEVRKLIQAEVDFLELK